MQPVFEYDVEQMQIDMGRKGWLPVDLANAASVSKSTVTRFYDGSYQTSRTAKKLAEALGFSLRRYQRALRVPA